MPHGRSLESRHSPATSLGVHQSPTLPRRFYAPGGNRAAHDMLRDRQIPHHSSKPGLRDSAPRSFS